MVIDYYWLFYFIVLLPSALFFSGKEEERRGTHWHLDFNGQGWLVEEKKSVVHDDLYKKIGGRKVYQNLRLDIYFLGISRDIYSYRE